MDGRRIAIWIVESIGVAIQLEKNIICPVAGSVIVHSAVSICNDACQQRCDGYRFYIGVMFMKPFDSISSCKGLTRFPQERWNHFAFHDFVN